MYAENVEKLVNYAIAKENENFNNMLTQKVLTNKHYSSSASLAKRVNCAVAKKMNLMDMSAWSNLKVDNLQEK